jgi:hypothetical protein
MMKFKLGLMIGGTVGYLVGSGKGAEMWSDYRSRSRHETDELLNFTDVAAGTPVAIVVEETFEASDLG